VYPRKPGPVAVPPSWRRRGGEGLQERQHQQPEQRHVDAGGEGRREDPLLPPLHGHAAEEAAEAGGEGPHAGRGEALRGQHGEPSHGRDSRRFTVDCVLLNPPPPFRSKLVAPAQRLRMCMGKVDEKAPEYIRMADSLK